MNKEEIQNKIDDLIWKANHTINYKEWQKLDLQIYKLEMKLKRGDEKCL